MSDFLFKNNSYFLSLPPYIQDNIILTSPDIRSENDLKCIVSGLMKDFNKNIYKFSFSI